MKKHPEWLNTAIFYQIYPQSFKDSNNDGIGDINGIIEKLDYIKGLGFNAIWINPIFESPFFDAGYDVSDYYKVAERYGTNQDLYNLFKIAHQKGMHVLLDLVPGHTSTECLWFKESCKAKKNKYTNRYIWTDDVFKSIKDYNVLRGISERDGAVMTNFFSIQPSLNYGFYEKKEDYQEKLEDEGPQSTIQEMIKIIKFYLKKGCDGFRCDMAGWLVKNDPDYNGTVRVWKQIISDVKTEYPNSVFVSEWNCPEKSLSAGFDMDFLLQDEFNPYNSQLTRVDKPYFKFDDNVKDGKIFFDHFNDVYESAIEENKFLSLISGNHDTKRITSWLNVDELKFYYTFMFTMPNVPFMYYGDEIGMKFVENLTSIEGGYKRTGTRSPMQWDTSLNAGFTTSNKTYIPLLKNRKGISIEEEEKDADSLYEFIKVLLAFKKNHIALDNDSSFSLVETKNYCPLVYIREKEDEKLLIVINTSNKSYTLSYALDLKGNLLFSIGEINIDNESRKIKVSPQSLLILE